MNATAFDYSIVADPRIFAQNRLPAHSDHAFYEHEPGDCDYCLNGRWKFAYAENYEKSIKGFEDPAYDCHGWDEIPVPAHIQMQGYDTPQYVNTQYPWDGHEAVRPGQIPVRFNPTASYVKYFEVPETMQGRELFISFQGVESAFALWLNGNYVGYSEDSFTPADFELTPYLTEGENKLAVQVFKWSSGSWCEDQDFFRFSGIFRDVILYVKPQLHVEDMKIRTLLDDSYQDAKLEIDLLVRSAKSVQGNMADTADDAEKEEPGHFSALMGADSFNTRKCSDSLSLPQQSIEDFRMRIRLSDDSGEVVHVQETPVKACAAVGDRMRMANVTGESAEHASCTVCGPDAGKDKDAVNISVSISIPSPRLWSAEDPYLYDLTIELVDEDGKTREIVTEKVGFRRFEIRDAVMHLNGKRIVFRGVNRHEFCARSGRVIDEEIILKDLVTMKRNNINAVRTSHYPNRTQLYRLCDQLGLYVIDETNLETHGTWDAIEKGKEDISFAVPGNRPEFRDMILDRANSMYQRDKNHPCILIWSCGNESFGGSTLQAAADFFHEMERVYTESDGLPRENGHAADACLPGLGTYYGRAVHYEGVFHDRRFQVSDMESTMYIPVDQIREYLKEHRDRPYISCEYAHAMGNSCGALEKYTNLTEEDPLYQGGFIWDYIDQCLEMKDRYGNIFMAYGGDHGERPHDGNFSGNGIVYGDDRTPTPKMQEVKFCYQAIQVGFETDSDAGAWPKRSLRVVIKNKNLFTATDAYDCRLSVMREGEEILRMPWQVSVGPLEEKSFELPEQVRSELFSDCAKQISETGENVLTVSFALKEDTAWAEAGHEVAYGQLAVRKNVACGQPAVRQEHCGDTGNNTASGLEVVRGWNNIGIRTGSFELLFSELLGGLISIRCDGRELLDKMVLPNFWRALTDNDVANQLAARAGVWKSGSAFISHKYEHGSRFTPCTVEWSGGKKSEARIYGKAGLAQPNWGTCMELPGWKNGREQSREQDGAEQPDESNGVEPSCGTAYIEGCEWVKITYSYYPAVPGEVKCTLAYTVHVDGSIDVEQTMPDTSMLGQLPEFTVLWPLCADLDRVTWYGPGPEETYRDKTHGKLGIWSGSVEGQMARYLRPQECGWKENARWAKVTDESGRGLIFEMEPDTGLGFSALPFSPQELDNADHPQELPAAYHTWVRVGQQMGVGGDDTWGALVHPEYLLDNSKEMKVRFKTRIIC